MGCAGSVDGSAKGKNQLFLSILYFLFYIFPIFSKPRIVGVKKAYQGNKKRMDKVAKGAGVASNMAETTNAAFKVEGRMEVSEKFNNPDFYPDVELELGFPDKKTSYTSKPCLEDVDDEYTKADKVRSLKKKQFNGLQDWYGGDRDFAEAMNAE